MDENRYFYKHSTYTNNASDDSSISSSAFPVPATFYTDVRRPKSRLGKRSTRNRVLQDLNQNPEYIKQTEQTDDRDTFPKSSTTHLTSNSTADSNKITDFLNFTPDSPKSVTPCTSILIESIVPLTFMFPMEPEPMSIDHSPQPESQSMKIDRLCESEPELIKVDHSPQPESQSIKIDRLCESELEPELIKVDHSSESLLSSNSSKESVNLSNEKRPIEVEFKRPESPPPPSKEDKNDFRFEPPLPVPPNPKSSERLPPFITVKGKSYSVVNILGSGGSSLVYQVLHPENNETLAIKRVHLSEVDETIAEGYIDEVKLLKSLQKSEFIIKMLDHEITYENDKKLLLVVMEKGDTDLSELIRNINKTKKLSILMILYYWHEMLSAVSEIHNSGIIHSDLKPANFLLVKGRLKLIDFGIASSIQGDMTSVYKDVFTGTLNYMSPEAVQFVNGSSGSIGYKITYKTDVWSLGCILYNLIYGRLPFQHMKKKWDKMRAIVDPNVQVEFPEVKGVPSVLMLALKSCLDKDPKRRLSVKELLQLPYCGN